ncbi:hypothetical protein [Vibrio sp.]|uniref:hypothetical protein n=1 Tax=Vibrio sp. TaxID=678 RepID=UPI00379E63A8
MMNLQNTVQPLLNLSFKAFTVNMLVLLSAVMTKPVDATQLCQVPTPFVAIDSDEDRVWPPIISNNFTVADLSLVNLWADWCAPCRKELPMLVSLAQHLNARQNDKSKFLISTLHVGNFNQSAQDTLATFDASALNRGVIEDFTTLKSFDVYGLPFTLVAKNDKVQFVANGYLNQTTQVYQDWLLCLMEQE